MTPLDTMRRRFLAVLHFVIGISAILGGGALVIWANGRMLNLPVTVLSRSGFTDFLLPGVFLYGAVGVHNLIACFLVATNEPGAERISLSAGVALLVWIAAEAALVDISHGLQLVYGGLAVLVLIDAIWIRRSTLATGNLTHVAGH